ncbi:tetratricopeptide repeat protein [Micromonospora endophytica]|uniref:tetratricopeptide repeat protein n=1 Tax=Micromonospora endophytica TaxID=515350 RepID=UPI0011C476DA|nr:tetratricopeptide repeat protein [Micromonospora endophytica]
MDLPETYLPAGLLRCGHCYEPMVEVDAGIEPGYQCQPGCRPTPLDAAQLADTIGRAILRHAPQVVPTSTPAHPQVAATYADRVLTHVTVGASGTDITLAWPTTSILLPNPHRNVQALRIDAARHLAGRNPQRALHLLYDSLTGINPATAPADLVHADAAARLAMVQLSLGQPNAAITWASYAHSSLTQLHGPTHPDSIASLHLLATAHRSANNHQHALRLLRQLADHLATTDGPTAHRTLATHATIALALHHLGHCQPARTLLADTITAHRRAHPRHPATTRMQQHLTRIWRDCASKGHDHPESSKPVMPPASPRPPPDPQRVVDTGRPGTRRGQACAPATTHSPRKRHPRTMSRYIRLGRQSAVDSDHL